MPQRNEYAWNTMLSAFAGSGDPRRAKRIFDEMPHRTAVSFNALITSYACTGKNLAGARAVLEKMPQWATASLNAMVMAYAQTGHSVESKLLFDQMPQKNVISWNAMLAACSGEGLIDYAASIFESMPERDVISWNAMLAATAQAGRSDAAAALLGSMLLEGIRPGEATFTCLLVEEAFEVRSRISTPFRSTSAQRRARITPDRASGGATHRSAPLPQRLRCSMALAPRGLQVRQGCPPGGICRCSNFTPHGRYASRNVPRRTSRLKGS